MDVATGWAYHHKTRTLRTNHPDDWHRLWCVWLWLMGESWGRAHRAAVHEGWDAALFGDLDSARDALRCCRFLDSEDRIPEDSWAEWFGPIDKWMDHQRTIAPLGGAKRAATGVRDPVTKRFRKSQPNERESQPNPSPGPAQPQPRASTSLPASQQPAAQAGLADASPPDGGASATFAFPPFGDVVKLRETP